MSTTQRWLLIFTVMAISVVILIFVYSSAQSDIKLPNNTQYCAAIGKVFTPRLSKALAPHSKKMATQTGVFPLETGKSAMLTRAWLSEAAEHTIDVQYFIFSRDNVGLIAFNYLVLAADRGVKVRVLVDDFMMEFEEEEILALASHPNIQIKVFNPGVNVGKNILQKIKKLLTDFKGANHRMHNKIFVVDGKVLITGGRNIEGMYFDFDHQYNFRDRDVLLIGKAAQEGQSYFNEYWNNQLSVDVSGLIEEASRPIDFQAKLNSLNEYACNPDNYWPEIRQDVASLPNVFPSIERSGELIWTEKASLVCDAPEKNEVINGQYKGSATTNYLLELVSNAQKSIEIQTPYLVTSESTRKLFEEKVNEGVNLRILTNSLASTDNVEAFSGYQRDREEILETGVQVYEFKPDAVTRFRIASSRLQKRLGHTAIFGTHAKTMVVDDKITVIGTFNLDPRSANLNTECLAVIENEQVAKDILEGIEEEFKPENSWRVTKDWNPDGEVDLKKRIKTRTRYVIPKEVL